MPQISEDFGAFLGRPSEAPPAGIGDAFSEFLGEPKSKAKSPIGPVPGMELLSLSGQPPAAATFQPDVQQVGSTIGNFLGIPDDGFLKAAARVGKKAAENVTTWMEAAGQAGVGQEGAFLPNPPGSEELIRYHQASGLPMVPLSEGTRPGSLLHGVASGAEALTSPTAMTNLGGIAAAQFVPGLNVALDSFLAYQGGKAASGAVYKAVENYQKGDLNGFAEELGLGTFDALLAAVMVRAAARGAEPVADAIRSRIEGWKTARLKKAIDAAEKRVGELFPTTPTDPETPPTGGGPAAPAAPSGGPAAPAAAPEETPGYPVEVRGPGGTAQTVQVKELQQTLLDHIVDEMGKGNIEPTGRVEEPAPPSLLDEAVRATEERPATVETRTPVADDFQKFLTEGPGEKGGREELAKTEHPETSPLLMAQEPETATPSAPQKPEEAKKPSEPIEKAEVTAPKPSEPRGEGMPGSAVKVKVPGEETSYQGNYEVREAADVQPSHNPFSFEPNPAYEFRNDRDYRDTQNAARVLEHSNPEKFDPEFVLTESPTAEHGPPVIDARGNVLGGNNRSMTIKRVYENAPEAAVRYKNMLVENAAKYGLNPETVQSMKQPMLVRSVTTESPQAAITDMNKKGSAPLRQAEQAVADGSRMSSKTVETIVGRIEDQGEGASLADALRGEDAVEVVDSLIKDGVATEEERAGLLDDRSQLTIEAKARIARALVGRLFPDAAAYNRAKPELRNKLERIAPQVLRVENRKVWSLTEPLKQALDLIENAQAHGTKNVADVAAQQSIGEIGPTYSPESVALARAIQQSPVKAAQAFRRYANDEALSREGAQALMFEPPTQEEAFDDAFQPRQPQPTVSRELERWARSQGGFDITTGEVNPHAAWNLKMGEDTYWADAEKQWLNETYGVEGSAATDVLLGTKRWTGGAPQKAGGKTPDQIRKEWAAIEREYLGSLAHTEREPSSALYEPQVGPETGGPFLEGMPHFDPDLPYKRLAEWARSERSETKPIVYVNQPVTEIVRRALGMANGFSGVFLTENHVNRVIEAVTGAAGDVGSFGPEASKRLLGLAQDIRGAKLINPNIILVRADMPREIVLKAVEHEEIHSVQMDLAQQLGQSYHLSGREAREVLDRTPNGRRIAAILIYNGYSDNARVLVEEVAAYAFSGDRELLEMSEEDVVDFFDAYTDVLIRKYGDQVHLRFGETSAQYRSRHEASQLREEARRLGSSQAARREIRNAPATAGGVGPTPSFWARLKRATRDLVEDLTGQAGPRAWRPNLSAPEFITESYDQEIRPRLEDLKVSLPQAGKALVAVLSPRQGTPTEALDALMQMKGKREKIQFLLEQTMADIKRMFAKMTQQDAIDFMDRIKTGQLQRTPELQRIAAMYRQVDDGIYELIKQYKPDVNYKEDHFRIFWKRIPGPVPGAAGGTKEFKGLANRPLEGTKGMLKRATLADVSEGIDRGGVPFSYNPQVLFEMSIADAMRYVTAHRMWEKIGELGFRKFARTPADAPDGYEALDDKIARVVHPEKTESGRTVYVEEGKWYVEKNVQRLLTNYLSRDWFRTGELASFTRPMLALKNFATALELSISPFHAAFETIEAVASQAGLGVARAWNQGIVQADPAALVKGLREIATAGYAPRGVSQLGTNVLRYVSDATAFKATARGARFLKDWPEIDELIDDMFTGGAKMGMHEDYRLSTYQAFRDNVATKNYLGAAARTIPGLNELLMKPLFEIYIPRLKIGFFLKEYAQQLEQNAGEIAGDRLSRARLAREVWDRVENRFGEMNFDNLWWNRTFKTFLQFWFRSVTWKLGNVRGFGSALSNQARQMTNWGGPPPPVPPGGGGTSIPGSRGAGAKKLPVPYLDPSFAWLFGLTMTSVVIANIIQMMNGEGMTKEAKDIIAPRIGGVDSRGKPLRVNIATYLKDAAHFVKSPRQYLTSSFSAMANRIPEIWENRDYFGNYIADPDDPFHEKALAMFWHAVGKPIVISSYQRGEELAASKKQQLLGLAGFTRAASNTDFSAAELVAAEHSHRKFGPQTKAQVEKGKLSRQLKEQVIQNTPGVDEKIAQAVQEGHLSARAAYEIRRTGVESYLERTTKSLGISAALDVWDKANAQERQELRHILENKEHLINTAPIEQREGLRLRYRKALGQPTSRLTPPPGARSLPEIPAPA